MSAEHPEIFKAFKDQAENKAVKDSIILSFYEDNGVKIDDMITNVFDKSLELDHFRLLIRMEQKDVILESDFRSFVGHCIFNDQAKLDYCSKVLQMGIELITEK
jgi:hypothetical protein